MSEVKAYEEHAFGCPRLKDARAACVCLQNAPAYQAPTEMASLTQIKVSIAALNANHKALKEHLEAIEQSQGKLLAALNELQADFNQWPHWRNGLVDELARLDHKLFVISGKLDFGAGRAAAAPG